MIGKYSAEKCSLTATLMREGEKSKGGEDNEDNSGDDMSEEEEQKKSAKKKAAAVEIKQTGDATGKKQEK